MNIHTPLPHRKPKEHGFTAVELLITLFIAAIFLFAGYAMYTTVTTYSANSRHRAQADRIAYDYLQRYQATVATTCAPSTPVDSASLASDPNAVGLYNPTITVTLKCPLTGVSSVTELTARVTYIEGSVTKVVELELYATK